MTTRGTGTVDEEEFADAFARALLMPEEAIRRWHRQGQPAWELAWRFQVPVEHVVDRLRELGLA